MARDHDGREIRVRIAQPIAHRRFRADGHRRRAHYALTALLSVPRRHRHRFNVWATELWTLDLQIDADNREDAGRTARDHLTRARSYGDGWLSSAALVRAAPARPAPAEAAMSAQQPRRLLTTQAAADALGIGRTTIFALLKSGELDSVAIGRRRFVSAEQIDYYVRSRS